MIESKCVGKVTDKQGKVIGYTLQDKDGKTINFYTEALKEHIRNKRIIVENLKLTNDNRLTATRENKENKILNRAKLMGLDIIEIVTECNHKCYVINQSTDSKILYIPSDVKQIRVSNGERGSRDLESLMRLKDTISFKGNLTVIGGEGLEIGNSLFLDSNAKTINLAKFKPYKLKSAEYMFCAVKCEKLDLTNLRFNSSMNRYRMFFNSKTNIILTKEEYQKQFSLITKGIKEDTNNRISIQVKVLNDKESYVKILREDNYNIVERIISNINLFNRLLDLDYYAGSFEEIYEFYREKHGIGYSVSNITEDKVHIGVYEINKDWTKTDIELEEAEDFIENFVKI